MWRCQCALVSHYVPLTLARACRRARLVKVFVLAKTFLFLHFTFTAPAETTVFVVVLAARNESAPKRQRIRRVRCVSENCVPSNKQYIPFFPPSSE